MCLCVCMYVCMHICICMCVCVLYNGCTYMYMCVYACVCVCVCVYVSSYSVCGSSYLTMKGGCNFAAAMGGGWYECPNGHTYYVSECGMPMQEYHCPECGATIGGSDHVLVCGWLFIVLICAPFVFFVCVCWGGRVKKRGAWHSSQVTLWCWLHVLLLMWNP